jgi:hypothetical protein
VLANDVDLDGDLFTAVLTNGSKTSAGGSISLSTNGSFTYTPPSSTYTGTDTFQYKVCATCAPAAVSIAVGKAPTAVADSISMTFGVPSLTVAAPGLLSNDKDPDGDPLIISEVNYSSSIVGRTITLASGASLTVNEDGSLTYVPYAGFIGKDVFTYRVCENIPGGLCSNTVVSTIKVNAAPTTVADNYTGKKNSKLSVNKPGVLGNDTDPNSDVLTAILVQKPVSGTLSLKTDGSFIYTPASNFVGNVTFTYKACESATTEKLCSAPTTVTITVK